jgi:diacylglycerol kinase (ATP)
MTPTRSGGAARAAATAHARGTEPATHAADGRALKGKRGLQRLVNAFGYSRDGLLDAWRQEDAFRQEVVLAAIMIPAALLLPVGLVEKVLLIAVVVLVLVVELLNTAVEAAIDRDSFEINPLGKRAKDLGSAAVLLSLLLAAGTWIAILAAHLLPHLHG